MLILPSAFQSLGIIPATLLLIFAGFVSGVGLFLLASASLRVANGRKADFAVLAKATFPRLAPVFDFAILLKCLGVAISYLVIIGQTVPDLMKMVISDPPSLLLNSNFWMTIGAALIAPVVYMPKMDSLKYTSFLGMTSIVYMVILSFYMLLNGSYGLVSSIPLWNINGDGISFVKNFGVFVFAFTCHQNMLPIQNEAKKNGWRDMLQIICVCICLALLMYNLFAICSVAVFGGQAIRDNIIDMYPTTGALFIIARLLYSFLVLSSLPLQTFPARNSIAKIISYFSPLFASSYERIIYYTSTTAILLFFWIFACTGLNLKLLIRLVGSTAGPILCYILPSLFWLSLESKNPWNALKIISIILFFFGLASMGISTAALFL